MQPQHAHRQVDHNVSGDSDLAYQEAILQSVSRTFALTIPQMPPALVGVIGNAYLLCRIADTIEDEVSLSAEQKQYFSKQFILVVQGRASAEEFSEALFPRLSDVMLEAEKDLVKNTARVIRITQAFTKAQQSSLLRCVEIMSKGMSLFQMQQYPDGLDKLVQMNQYCYYVAGVVGEMLTELCSQYSEEIAVNHDQLMEYAVSFGQGLQMTNILKDIWEDQKRGVCWLPKDIFEQYGFHLRDLTPENLDQAYVKGLKHLVAITHGHLYQALQYILLIPRKERGIRKFCSWAVGMALLTLHKINKNPMFHQGQSVKISRKSVRWTILLTNLSVGSNLMLRSLFRLAAKELPAPIYQPSHQPSVQEWQNIDWAAIQNQLTQ